MDAEQAMAIFDEAEALFDNDEFQLARTRYFAFLDVFDAGGRGESTIVLARAWRSAGACSFNLDEYAGARLQILRSRELYQLAGDSKGVASCDDRLSMVDGRLGNHESSLDFALAAVRTYVDLGDRAGIAEAGFDAGVALLRLGREREAANQFLAAFFQYQALDKASGMIRAARAHGDALMGLGDFEVAAGRYTEGLRVATETEDRRNIRVLAKSLGLSLFSLKRYDQALPYYRIAFDEASRGSDGAVIDAARFDLAHTLQALGLPAED